MLTKEQLNILSVFSEDIFTSLTFKQIKQASKQKSNNIVQIALKEFQKEDIVKIKQIADVSSYSLNLDNNLTLAYLNLINENKLKKTKIPHEILKEMQDKISKYTNFFILAVFGSYAKGKPTGKSDLDIAIMIDSESAKKEIIPYLETIKRREIMAIDYHIFTEKEFLEMLSADYENLGKQIYKNSIIYCGFVEYCRLIKRQVK